MGQQQVKITTDMIATVFFSKPTAEDREASKNYNKQLHGSYIVYMYNIKKTIYKTINYDL